MHIELPVPYSSPGEPAHRARLIEPDTVTLAWLRGSTPASMHARLPRAVRRWPVRLAVMAGEPETGLTFTAAD